MSENEGRPNPWRYASAGMEFITAFGLLLGAGLLADRWLNSLPLFTLIGAAAGFAAGMLRLVKAGRELQRSQKHAEDEDESPPSG
jgi:F0F1-type ATP synthase assembly protein I